MFIPVVLNTVPGTLLDDYMTTLTGAVRIIRAPDLASLQIIDQTEIPKRFSVDVQNSLEPLVDCVLNYWSNYVPLVSGETRITEAMGCLGVAWYGLSAGTLVYQRKTDMAEIACLLPGAAIICLNTGALSYSPLAIDRFTRALEPRQGNLEAPHAGFGATSGGAHTRGLVDAGLSVLTFVGFGIGGPWGLALAGLAAGSEAIFNAFFNTGQTPLPEQIDQIVQDLLGQQEITEKANDINTSLSTLKQNMDNFATMDTLQKNTLRDVAVHQVQDSSALNAALNYLSGGASVTIDGDIEDLKRKTLTLYILGAATKLAWIKVAIILDDSPESIKDRYKSGYRPMLVQIGMAACEYAAQVQDDIEAAIRERLAQISVVYRTEVELVITRPVQVGLWAFQDSADPWDSEGDQKHYREMTATDTGCYQQKQHKDICEQKLADYRTRINKGLIDKYKYDAQHVNELLKALGATYEKYMKP